MSGSDHDDDSNCYDVFELMSKPLLALEIIGKKVTVEMKCKRQKNASGYFHSLDPVAGHVLLVNFLTETDASLICPSATTTTQLIFSRLITKIIVTPEDIFPHDMNTLFDGKFDVPQHKTTAVETEFVK